MIVRTMPDELGLRHVAWIQHNRQLLDKLSGGRIGYEIAVQQLEAHPLPHYQRARASAETERKRRSARILTCPDPAASWGRGCGLCELGE